MTTKSEEPHSEAQAPTNGSDQARMPRQRGRPRRLPQESKKTSLAFTPTEVEAAIAQLFCQGLAISKIREEAKRRFNIKLSREEPWKILTRIARRDGFQYRPSLVEGMSECIKKQYPWLTDCKVVETGNLHDVAAKGAECLLDLVKQRCGPPLGTEKYDIGYAGGRCLRELAREFAKLLCQPTPIDPRPKKIVFHSIVAGFGDEDPETDPNFFYPYFVHPSMQVDTQHVALYAPGMVEPQKVEELKEYPLIANAFNRVNEIDIFITSASHWEDEHSTLQTLLKRSKPSLDVLRDAGTIGDMCWQPFSKTGPINLTEHKPELQAMVLVSLDELPQRIKEGKEVLLVLGPCGRCNKPKVDILKAILDTKEHLITRLIVDSRTARGLILHDCGPDQTDHERRDSATPSALPNGLENGSVRGVRS